MQVDCWIYCQIKMRTIILITLGLTHLFVWCASSSIGRSSDLTDSPDISELLAADPTTSEPDGDSGWSTTDTIILVAVLCGFFFIVLPIICCILNVLGCIKCICCCGCCCCKD